jgi:hypothetical protein
VVLTFITIKVNQPLCSHLISVLGVSYSREEPYLTASIIVTGSKNTSNQWIETEKEVALHYIIPTGKYSGDLAKQMKKPSVGSLLRTALKRKMVRVYLKGNFPCIHTQHLTTKQFIFYGMMYITNITQVNDVKILVLFTLQPCSEKNKQLLANFK